MELMEPNKVSLFLQQCYDSKTNQFNWCQKNYNPLYSGCLGVQSLALKIIYIVAGEKVFDENRIGPTITRYQKEDGYFYNLSKDKNIIRAETRQALSALKNYKIKPKYELKFMDEFLDVDMIKKFLYNLDWKNPWGAGSHLSHLMFFLSLCDRSLNTWIYNDFLPCLWKGDGWYRGNPYPYVKINGLMKVLSGLVSDNRSIPHSAEIIDVCLKNKAEDNACNIMDIIFCLYYCYKDSDYKKQEIVDRLGFYFMVIKDYWIDNGFSFFKNSSQTSYLGFNITNGTRGPDIHGTILFLWALSLLNDVLGLGYNLRIQTT